MTGPDPWTDMPAWLAAHDPLTVVPWRDPLVEAHGHPPDSVYVETYWLPGLGPTTLLLYRRLVRYLGDAPSLRVDLLPLARELGVGKFAPRRASPLVRGFARLVRFGLAEPLGDVLAVRTMLASLTRYQVDHLPAHLAHAVDA